VRCRRGDWRHLGLSHTIVQPPRSRASGADVLLRRPCPGRRAYLASPIFRSPILGRTSLGPRLRVREDGASRGWGWLHASTTWSRPSLLRRALTEGARAGASNDLRRISSMISRPLEISGPHWFPASTPSSALPDDIQLWTANHCISYRAGHGWEPARESESSGTRRISGDNLAQTLSTAGCGSRAGAIIPKLAEDVLDPPGVPGSSAAGEQPKFSANRAHPGPTPSPGSSSHLP
jgi:hypothetical protein